MRDTIITKYSIFLNMRGKRVSLEWDEDIISIILAFCSKYSHFVHGRWVLGGAHDIPNNLYKCQKSSEMIPS